MELDSVFGIAKKEIMDNVRNFWIVAITVIFTVLALATSYFGSLFSQGWQDLGITVTLMMSVVQVMVPIIGLMLGYAAIIGEIERGSMNSLLSLPVTRLEIVLGKFLGLGGVLSFTILVGFGIAGVVIGFNVSDVNYVDYFIFIGSTILIGLVFLSVSLFFSTIFKKRSAAMGGAIFLWFFFNMILPMVLVGIAVAGMDLMDIVAGTAPDWYFALQLINPMSVYSTLVTLTFSSVSTIGGGFPITYPSFYTCELMILILLTWIIGFVSLAFWRFNRKDV